MRRRRTLARRPSSRSAKKSGLRRLLAGPLHLFAALRRRPAVLAIVCAITAGVTAAALVLPGQLASVRPSFPIEPAADQEMYQLLVGDEPSSGPGDLPGPAVLKTLQTRVYTVAAGDTVSAIAQRFRLNLDTVLSWNDIRDARSLGPGAVLTVPNADGLKYRVRRGDTLEAIARRNGVSLNALLDWNQLATDIITPGEVLFLPGARLPPNEVARILGSLFIWPARGQITSWFGVRPDPFTGIRKLHPGLDIKADAGTPVVAALAGRATAGYNGSYGRYVILQHSGYQTLYAHLSRVLVEQGEQVAQGQKIGEVGSTGYSTGPHLHFGVFRSGEPVDPRKFLK